MSYQIKRTDKNQQDIMDALRDAGYCVHDTHELGRGFPDIVVGCREGNILMEVKSPGKKLNDKEKEFFNKWDGPVCVVDSPEFAVKIMNDVFGKSK
jgi:hypothetical protein